MGDALRRLRGTAEGELGASTDAATEFSDALDDVSDAAAGGGGGGGRGAGAGRSGGAAGAMREVGVAALDARDDFEDFKSGASSAFEGLVTGAKSVREALAGLLQDMSRVFANRAFEGIWGSFNFGGDALTRAMRGAGLPAFANGGMHSGGMRLVGERGPELELTGPARYYSAAQTQNLMAGAQGMGGSSGPIEIVLRAPEGFTAQQVSEIQGVSVRVTQQGLREFSRSMPDMVQRINRNPRDRW